MGIDGIEEIGGTPSETKVEAPKPKEVETAVKPVAKKTAAKKTPKASAKKAAPKKRPATKKVPVDNRPWQQIAPNVIQRVINR